MIVAQHPVKRAIFTQSLALHTMIERIPAIMGQRIIEDEQYYSNIAKEDAEGDYDVENTIYNNISVGLELDYQVQDELPNALLVMVFAYYDSALEYLKLLTKAKEARPSCIACTKGQTIDKDVQVRAKAIVDLRNLRNACVHRIFHENKISEPTPSINLEIVKQTLENADVIIEHLLEILGYNKSYKTSQQ